MNTTQETSTPPRIYERGGFWSLIATQFIGVFINNFLTILAILYLARYVYDAQAAPDEASAQRVGPIAAILCALPFIIFPGMFGALSDRYSKRTITIFTKYLEAALVVVAGAAFWTGNEIFIWVAVVLMATKSAVFSPSKYGILPEIVPDGQLSWANGVMQIGTIVPILLATFFAGPIHEVLGQDLTWAFAGMFVLSAVGIVTAYGVSNPPAASPGRPIPVNPWHGMQGHFAFLLSERRILVSIAGYIYFWFITYFLVITMMRLGFVTFNYTDTQITTMLAFAGLGAGLGSVAAGYLSREKIEVGLVPIGLVGVAITALLLAWPGWAYASVCAIVVCHGFAGGLFSVPFVATLQQRAPDNMKGGVMATVNMLTFFGIGGAAGLFLLLDTLPITTYQLFSIIGGVSILFAGAVCVAEPIYLLRTLLWLLSATLYRIKTLGHDRIPRRGGGLIVPNHTSFLDALMILASTDRHIRFIMAKSIYDVFWIKPLARLMDALPVSRGNRPRETMKSLQTASDAIRNGQLVCIFAEGQITRTGQLLPFRSGYQKIVKEVDAPIIPVHLDKLWGSIFSFAGGKFFWKIPSRIPYNLTVTFGEPLPSDTPPEVLRAAIQELGTEAYATRVLPEPVLHRAFVRNARRNLFRRAVADERSGPLSYFKLLTAVVVLAGKFRELLGDRQMVGVLLPPGNACAITNIALTMMGKIPVNLNYTASNRVLKSCAERCEMEHVITAKAFLEQLPMTVPAEAVYLEDVRASVTKDDRRRAALKALFYPVRAIERALGMEREPSRDDLATVVFSSGSEGEPKGVMLTHYNISANIDMALQVFPHKRGDVIVGILPIFHSFGFTATLWLPLTRGLSVIFHPSPLEPRKIGKLIAKYKGQILFATSTFLQGFIRRCSAADLGSLEFVICGAEKLAPRIRDAFKDKFGVEPLEGYGTTECAPIVSLNLPDFRSPGFYQRGTKRGTIGHPLPGISVKAVNPDTGETVPAGSPGVLCVKGANVMEGYLGMPDKTAEVLRDGWYETGDIVSIDEEGFITVTDRLARFSKIGGEMVSHTQVEDALHELVNVEERTFAVTGVPDESKGERLVVLHTLDNGEFDDMISKLDDIDLPKIFIPKQGAFYNIDEIPILGTGKMDIKAVKELAKKLYIGD